MPPRRRCTGPASRPACGGRRVADTRCRIWSSTLPAARRNRRYSRRRAGPLLPPLPAAVGTGRLRRAAPLLARLGGDPLFAAEAAAAVLREPAEILDDGKFGGHGCTSVEVSSPVSIRRTSRGSRRPLVQSSHSGPASSGKSRCPQRLQVRFRPESATAFCTGVPKPCNVCNRCNDCSRCNGSSGSGGSNGKAPTLASATCRIQVG